jgi:hypothetical protein
MEAAKQAAFSYWAQGSGKTTDCEEMYLNKRGQE